MAAAGSVLVPEWILDPLKGRSMVAVPATFKSAVTQGELLKAITDELMIALERTLERKCAEVYFEINSGKIRDSLLFEREHLRSFGVLKVHA